MLASGNKDSDKPSTRADAAKEVECRVWTSSESSPHDLAPPKGVPLGRGCTDGTALAF